MLMDGAVVLAFSRYVAVVLAFSVISESEIKHNPIIFSSSRNDFGGLPYNIIQRNTNPIARLQDSRLLALIQNTNRIAVFLDIEILVSTWIGNAGNKC